MTANRQRDRRWLPRLSGPRVMAGAIVIAMLAGTTWVVRDRLHAALIERPALLVASFVGLLITWVILIAALWFEHSLQRRFWKRRAERLTGIGRLAFPGWAERLARRAPDPLEWLAGPVLRTVMGQRMAQDWNEAGLGTKASRYLALLAASVALGWVLGARIAGPVLAVAFALLTPVGPHQWIRSRAAGARRRFGEQLPQALDTLAAGLAAGLSFEQALQYAGDELPDPVGGSFAHLARRVSLGVPIDEALASLLEAHPEESLALTVDGIVLQRRFGGDMVAMLEETAQLLREKVELEREVRAVTVQGRLSGVVVSGLVPVSAALLLVFNPRYMDILFETLIGQVLTAIALLLLFSGWVVISRLVRITY